MGEYHWLEQILSFISGGAIAGVITALANRKKTKSDIATQNIEAACKLRDDALKEYMSIKDNLEQCKIFLDNAQKQLDVAKNYIDEICAILDQNGICHPPKPEELFGK